MSFHLAISVSVLLRWNTSIGRDNVAQQEMPLNKERFPRYDLRCKGDVGDGLNGITHQRDLID